MKLGIHFADFSVAGEPPDLGGTGERKTLRLVAKYADATNMFALGHDVVAAKVDVLKRHCDTEGRDPEGFLAAMDGYAKLGVSHVQLMPTGPDPVTYVAQLSEFIPRLADVG